jgi:long-chain-fatty-acyl-CoA reductase
MKAPLIICGRRVTSSDNGVSECESRAGVVSLPRLDEKIVDELISSPRDVLRDVQLFEIISFLHNVGHNWKSKEYTRRRLYVRYLCRLYGYSEEMAEAEANWIAMLLSSHYRLYDTLATELGSWHVVDEWVPCQEAYVRAMPRGRVLHLVPGNVPLSGVVSVLRATLTKNSSVVKASSDDPMTPIALAQSFMDVDADHPVTKALSVVHWRGGQETALEQRLLRDADAICAWGGERAMEEAARHASPMAEILKFGPRRSVAIVGQGADLKKAARGLAHDVCMYDQRACFSAQRVFVEGSVAGFITELEEALRNYETLLPKGTHDFDERAAWALGEQQARFSGAEVRSGDDQRWSIITVPPHEVEDHPQGRMIFVHPIDSVSQATDELDANVQTVAVAPMELGLSIRDACAARGVARIVDLGMTNVFRSGGSHDGMYPLQRLVRLVSMELPSSVPVKGMAIPIDQTTFLEHNRFVEFIP